MSDAEVRVVATHGHLELTPERWRMVVQPNGHGVLHTPYRVTAGRLDDLWLIVRMTHPRLMVVLETAQPEYRDADEPPRWWHRLIALLSELWP